jgi:hypothetical protein
MEEEQKSIEKERENVFRQAMRMIGSNRSLINGYSIQHGSASRKNYKRKEVGLRDILHAYKNVCKTMTCTNTPFIKRAWLSSCSWQGSEEPGIWTCLFEGVGEDVEKGRQEDVLVVHLSGCKVYLKGTRAFITR